MFVQEDKTGEIVGTAIINRIQVDGYSDGDWHYLATDDEIMVLHTLIISVRPEHRGSGKMFLDFYENYTEALICGWIPMQGALRREPFTGSIVIMKSESFRQCSTAFPE